MSTEKPSPTSPAPTITLASIKRLEIAAAAARAKPLASLVALTPWEVVALCALARRALEQP